MISSAASVGRQGPPGPQGPAGPQGPSGGGGGSSTSGQFNTTITAGVNNNVPTNGQNLIILGGNTGSFTLTGLDLATLPAAGQTRPIYIVNASAFAGTISHKDSRTSGANHYQFDFVKPGLAAGAQISLGPNGGTVACYVNLLTGFLVVVAVDRRAFTHLLASSVHPGDGSDATAAIQGLINQAGSTGMPYRIYLDRTPAGGNYGLSGSLFNPYTGVSIEGDNALDATGTGFNQAGLSTFYGLVMGRTYPDPTYTIRGAWTAVTTAQQLLQISIFDGGCVNGLGLFATTTATFTHPGYFTSATVTVDNTANLPSVMNIGGFAYSLAGVTDATHAVVLARDPSVPSGTTVVIGTKVGSGLYVEAMVDPNQTVTSGSLTIAASSGGAGASLSPFANAFNWTISGNGVGGNMMNVAITTTNGTFTLSGGNVTPGTLHHCAFSYDGANLYLLFDGTVVAHTAATGTIVQNWYETVTLGAQLQGWPKGPVLNGTGGAGIMVDGFRIEVLPVHNSLAGYTPPTAPYGCRPIATSIVTNFASANRPVVLGNDGITNLASSWVLGSSSLNRSNLPRSDFGAPVWVQWYSTSLGVLYTTNQNVRYVKFSLYGGGVYANGVLNSIIERNFFRCLAGVTFDNFTYESRIEGNIFIAAVPSTFGSNNALNGSWLWAIGCLGGVQFPAVTSNQVQAGLWCCVSEFGGMFENNYFVTNGQGGFCFPGTDGSASVVMIENYIYDEAGVCAYAPVYCGNMGRLTIEGGALAPGGGSTTNLACLVIDGANDVEAHCFWQTFLQFTMPRIYQLTPMSKPAIVSGNSYTGVDIPWLPPTGTAGVGPIVVVNQDRDAAPTRLQVAASTAPSVNQNLWRVLELTDPANAVGATPFTVTLPWGWDGFERNYRNRTGATATIQLPAIPAWVTATAYKVGAYVTRSGTLYKCTTAIATSATAPTATVFGQTNADGSGVWTCWGPVGAAITVAAGATTRVRSDGAQLLPA